MKRTSGQHAARRCLQICKRGWGIAFAAAKVGVGGASGLLSVTGAIAAGTATVHKLAEHSKLQSAPVRETELVVPWGIGFKNKHPIAVAAGVAARGTELAAVHVCQWRIGYGAKVSTRWIIPAGNHRSGEL